MNLNILAYFIYLPVTVIIIYYLGKICYQNGNVYVEQLVPDHKEECVRVNKMLLIAFYLMNMGYCAIALINWTQITSFQQLTEIVSFKVGIMVMLIAFMHYFNLFWISKYGKVMIDKYF